MYKIEYDQIQPPFHTPTAPLSIIYPQHMIPSQELACTQFTHSKEEKIKDAYLTHIYAIDE